MFTVNNLIIYPLRHTLAFSFAYVCAAAAAVVCAHYYINDNLANWERPEKVINPRFCASAFGLGALPKTHTPLVRLLARTISRRQPRLILLKTTIYKFTALDFRIFRLERCGRSNLWDGFCFCCFVKFCRVSHDSKHRSKYVHILFILTHIKCIIAVIMKSPPYNWY
jgi:hypothetical protein